LEEIGRGGMGVVYKARQKSLDRLVAVKTLLPGLSSPEYLRRFRTEASTAAGLQHTNIVAIHEVGVWQGQQYLVMDYVSGPSLTQVIAESGNQKTDFRRSARWLKIIAQAVHYAHEQGILHRDLKPSNILIDPTDAPRVTDFGLAKRFGEESQLTLSGQVLGSPSFMPPEQAETKRGKISRRSDVYSLGATLYHLLTGRPPFQGETLTEVLHQVLHAEPVAPRELNPSIPRDLETICLKCLEKEPGRRYASAQILADELDRFLAGKPVLARPLGPVGKTWRWCRRKPVVASLSAGLLAVLVLGVAGVLWQWNRAERVAKEEIRQRARAGASEAQARRRAYASDMKAAQVALEQNNLGLAVTLLRRYFPQPGEEDLRGLEWRYLWQQSRGDEFQSFAHPVMVEVAVLSPDGKCLVTKGNDQRIRVWQVSSGRQILEFEALAFEQPRKAIAFSPDGRWLVASGNTPHRYNALANTAEPGLEVRDTRDWRVVRRLESAEAPFCFSPDGRRLATMGPDGLAVWELRDWTRQVLSNSYASYRNLAFTPDGSSVIYSPFYIGGSHGWPTGSPIRLWDMAKGTEKPIEGEDLSVSLAVSPDGRWLASGSQEGQICLWDLATLHQVSRFRAHQALVYGLAFSPDSKLLATGGADQIIHLWEAGTTNKLRSLKGHLHEVRSVEFSSDGRLLISASKDGTAKLWKLESGPAGLRTFALDAGEVPVGPLPDATALITSNERKELTQFRRLPDGDSVRSMPWFKTEQPGFAAGTIFPSSQRAVAVTTNGTVHVWNQQTRFHVREVHLATSAFIPRLLSPDGRWLIGMHNELKLWLYDLAASRPAQELEGSRYSAAFSPDGHWLAYSTRSNVIKLWNLVNNQPRLAFKGPHWRVDSLTFSPDSHLLAGGGWEGKVWLWSVATGQALLAPLEHPPSIGQLFFSFDGKTLITMAGDRTMRWWHVVTGQEMLLFNDCGIVSAFENDSPAEWNPGGNLLIWSDREGLVRVTQLPTLAEIDTIERRNPRSR
jgi:WD40 repeat protein